MRQIRQIPDAIIERAAELWARALRKPSFDNGDRSFAGFVGMAMISSLADRKAEQTRDMDTKIDAFRSSLADHLKFSRDHEGEETGKTDKYGPIKYYLETYLSTDYSPCRTLCECAAKVGIPIELFSIKSNVSLYHDSVSAAFGYGIEPTYHYPLSDGRWLLCDLRGAEMPKIIKAVESGLLPELRVERGLRA